MPTKHMLQQQLDETREDLAAERERAERAREQLRQIEFELRASRTEANNARERANQLADMVQSREAETMRLAGQLEGMREALTSLGLFGKGEA